jgi:hypothetical protein
VAAGWFDHGRVWCGYALRAAAEEAGGWGVVWPVPVMAGAAGLAADVRRVRRRRRLPASTRSVTAARLLKQALRQFQRIADPLMTANCLFGLALVASAGNNHTLAANLLGAAAARYDASGTKLLAALGREHEALLATTRAAIGGDRFEAEHHHGATLPPAQALALALQGGPGAAAG